MKIDKISLDGQILETGQASISASNQGFMSGIGAFETLRVSSGKVFLLNEHFERLSSSLMALQIDWPDERKKYCEWIDEIIQGVGHEQDSRIRFLVTDNNGRASTAIYMSLIGKSEPAAYKAQVIQSTHRTRPEYFNKTGFRIKSPEYTAARLAKLELPDAKTEGILLSPDGYVAEALTSNIFWADGGQLYTSPLSLGILPGTVRSYLLRSHKIQEKLITAKQLEAADEIFLTNAVRYINPLSQINRTEKPGIDGLEYKKLFKSIGFDVKHKSVDIHSFSSVT